ncbi:hypothetical protein EMIT0111MI5_20354 [Burkholderia sp. IT-111MI5]
MCRTFDGIETKEQAVLKVSIFGTRLDLGAVQCAPGPAKQVRSGGAGRFRRRVSGCWMRSRSLCEPCLYMHTARCGAVGDVP